MKSESLLKAYLEPDRIEAGCDEAGRGCLAGPVFAASVVLPPSFKCKGLTDSKKLTDKKRRELRPVIEREAISFSVGICSPEDIDSLNILWASVEAMHRALSQLSVVPQHILVDGNKFRSYNDIPYTCVVGGDAKYLSIAAASILAKSGVASPTVNSPFVLNASSVSTLLICSAMLLQLDGITGVSIMLRSLIPSSRL